MNTNIKEMILNKLTMHGYLYHKYGREEDEQQFHYNMILLHKVLGNKTIEETCKYFEQWGDNLVREHEQNVQNKQVSRQTNKLWN